MIYKIFVFIIVLFITSCNSSEKASNSGEKIKDFQFTNELIHETSPYLLQHAHNPVNWYPWGDKALKKAKDENKLLLISVGYAACHWCHVMEHESFEDTAVANFMNDNFVCIKVDREERPDIDQIYMDAVQLITGRGGWPLNCFALPDGKPFYGGTYFPKEKWSEILSKVSNFYNENPNEITKQAEKLMEGIVANENIYSDVETKPIKENELNELVDSWMERMDFEKGGHQRTPKFPLPVGYEFLMQYEEKNDNPKVTEIINTTLTKMAEGGIYDQIGGGFARYSTDENWKVPHFEKMLYDNAQLLSLYSNRYKATKNPLYKTIIEETSEFIEREWRDPSGGVYSSLDADSEGEEGKYYVWTALELDSILKEDSKLIKSYYNVKSSGNWEHGRNILFINKSKSKFAKKNNLSLIDFQTKLNKAKSLLLKAREGKIKPGLDDKILTAWNGLLLKGYVDAYKAFGEEKYLKLALKSADFLKTKMISNDFQVFRNYKANKSTINGFLDDYAFVISGYISIYQATFDDQWLNLANNLTKYVNTHFTDSKSNYYFFTSDLDKKLVTRKKSIPDNVIASSNSEMAKNLFVLGHYFYNNDYINKAELMALQVKENARLGGTYYANWDQLLHWMVYPPNEVAIVGDDAKAYLKDWNSNYLPNVFVLGSKNKGKLELLENKFVEGETRIYVCKNKSCKAPVNKVSDGLILLEK